MAIHPALLVLFSQSHERVWANTLPLHDNLMVEVESGADVAAGQHDFHSQVAAVIPGREGKKSTRGLIEPSGQINAPYSLTP